MVRLADPSGNETVRIQNALTAGGLVQLAPGTWETGPLSMVAGGVLDIENDACLRAITRLYTKYDPVVLCRDISGARVTGRGEINVPHDPKYGLPASKEQWRHCIRLSSARDCRVDGGLTLKTRGGDGICIGAAMYKKPVVREPSRNLVIDGITCDNCYRDAIAVAWVDGLHIRGCALRNTNGTAAEGGIALESNGPENSIKNVKVEQSVLTGNNGYGLQIQNRSGLGLGGMSVEIKDCVIEGGRKGAFSMRYGPTDLNVPVHVSMDGCKLYSRYDSMIHLPYLVNSALLIKNTQLFRLWGRAQYGDVRFYWDDNWEEQTPFASEDFNGVEFDNVVADYDDFRVYNYQANRDPTLPIPGIRGYIWRRGPVERYAGSALWLLGL